jgi:hypothetical protein
VLVRWPGRGADVVPVEQRAGAVADEA